MSEKNVEGRPAMPYEAFRKYLRFFHDKVFYRKTYAVNKEAVPPVGTPLLIVSNHQNCLNDPLGVVLSFRDRKVNVITRADVFALSPIANKFLRAIGLLPAFRLGWEGEAALSKNEETFKASEEALLKGNTVMMFPEGGHQDKHWLGNFSFGYTKLAFEAAEMGNFEKEIFILPSCNHYSDYFGLQNRFMVKYGTPISLKPFYELYKTKPRTAQRQVNALVREQIAGLMLNINDLDNYDTAYFLCSEWGRDYAEGRGVDADNLPDILLVQREIIEHLDKSHHENEPETAELYRYTRELIDGIKKTSISYTQLSKAPKVGFTLLKTLLLIVFFPLFAFCLWPSLFIYAPGMLVFKAKAKDPMFEGTFVFAVGALFALPLFTIIMFIIDALCFNVWTAIIHVLAIPLMMFFAVKYAKCATRCFKELRYLLSKTKVNKLRELKERIDNIMKTIMK